MKELIVFYSFGGKTRQLAHHMAQQRGAEAVEVFFEKTPSLLRSFLLCPAAIGQKKAKVRPFEADMAGCDKIIIMGPVWASNPAPPVNNIIDALPAGKQVELVMVSASGKSNREKVSAAVAQKGCTVVDYQDVASGAPPKAGK